LFGQIFIQLKNGNMHRKNIPPHILNYSCIQSGLAEYWINFNA